jgi:hypothetical protein
MSSLQQAIDRRRAEDAGAQPCHSMNAQVASLTVVTSADEKWIFPWHHLAVAHLTRSGEREELQLTFASHLVTIRGRNLGALAELVAAVRLATVRPAPGKYARSAEPEPFVDALLVTAHPDARGGAGAES